MELKNFNSWYFEKRIISDLVKHLHEKNVYVGRSDTFLNESNLKDFAEKELDLLIKSVENKGDTPLIKEFVPEILSLVDKFGNSGQSGGSAPYTAGSIISALKKLLLFQPISPVTGEDHEWDNSISEETWQNKRCYGVFKKGSKGDPYYLDAIIWKTPSGATWSGSAKDQDGNTVSSRQFIKEFPFTPKTFVIDVEEKEIAPDDWDFTIKDPSKLEEVWNYYKKKSS